MRTPLVATLLLFAACTPSGSTPDRYGQRVDDLFEHYDLEGGPGVAVAVIDHGETVFTAGYGLGSLELQSPITPTTVFDIASLSKQFTGFAIATLVREGELSLNDDIHKYIPELADFGQPITIGNLVHHTSGIRDWPGTMAIGGWLMDDVISFEQILDFAFHQSELNFVPGEEYTYSNTGYNLLAETVSRVSGQSFRAWTDQEIFKPLGMSHTHFHDDHTEVVPNRAFGYAPAGEGSWSLTPNNLTAIGSSSLYTTVEDLAKWVENFGSAEVGGRAVLDLAWTPDTLNDGSENPYAFGISHGTYRGLPRLAHSGSWASFRTYLVYFPEQDFGVVLLANHEMNAQQAAMKVVDIYLHDILQPAVENGGEDEAGEISVSDAILQSYEGTYRLGPGWYVEIRQEGDGLVTQATDEDPFPMEPRSEVEFWVGAYGASITFRRNVSGEVTGFTYRGIEAPRLSPDAPLSEAELQSFAGTYESGELRTAYEVRVQDGQLIMSHPKHGDVALSRAWRDDFHGDAWFLASVEFQRGQGGQVNGLVVNAGERNRSIRFTKR